MERSIREKVGPDQAPAQSHADADQFRLLDAETIVFDQFDEVVRRKSPLEPEKNLMLAILQEGVSCFQKQLLAKGHRGKNLFHEAEMWILQRDSDGIFSFENICDTLGISPQYLRAGLIAWKNRQLMRCFGAQNVMDTAADLQLALATTV